MELDNNVNTFTDVDESIRFVQETGIDALAISIGNLHGKYTATPNLNIQRLKRDQRPESNSFSSTWRIGY